MPPNPKYQPPYQDLFIYYITGRLKADPDIGNDNYIGNWEEEGDSFLFFKTPSDDRR